MTGENTYGSNFDIEIFQQEITYLLQTVEKVRSYLSGVNSMAGKVSECIGNVDNSGLYQQWSNLGETVKSIQSKYEERSAQFIEHLQNYANNTLVNNAEYKQFVTNSVNTLNDINSKLGSL